MRRSSWTSFVISTLLLAGLRGWAKLQAATSCGAKTVDGCRSSRNRRDTN